MFSFLLPKHVRQGRNLLKDATKLLAFKRDLWSDVTVADYKSHLRGLEEALKRSDRSGIRPTNGSADLNSRTCTTEQSSSATTFTYDRPSQAA